MLAGDIQNFVLAYLTPLVLSYLFLSSQSKEATAAFNVGLRLQSLLTIPAAAIVILGTPWIAPLWNHKDNDKWQERNRVLFYISGLLALIAGLVIVPLFLAATRYVFGLHESSSLVVVAAMLLSFLPISLSAPIESQLRVFEKQRFLARSNLFTHYFIGIPLAYVFIRLGHDGLAAFFGFFIPSFVLSLWLFTKRSSIEELRRLSLRASFPKFMLGRATLIKQSSGVLYAMNCLDISPSGCGVSGAFDVEFFVGEKVIGSIFLRKEKLFEFEGVIRSFSGRSYSKRNSSVRVGVEFHNLTIEAQLAIKQLIANLLPSENSQLLEKGTGTL